MFLCRLYVPNHTHSYALSHTHSFTHSHTHTLTHTQVLDVPIEIRGTRQSGTVRVPPTILKGTAFLGADFLRDLDPAVGGSGGGAADAEFGFPLRCDKVSGSHMTIPTADINALLYGSRNRGGTGSVNNRDFTLSFWFRQDPVPAGQEGRTRGLLEFVMSHGASIAMALPGPRTVAADHLRTYFLGANDDSSLDNFIDVPQPAADRAGWHMYTLVHRSMSVRPDVWIDGKHEYPSWICGGCGGCVVGCTCWQQFGGCRGCTGQPSCGAGDLNPTGDLMLCARPGTTSRQQFHGQLTRLGLFGRALTEPEINELYTRRGGEPTSWNEPLPPPLSSSSPSSSPSPSPVLSPSPSVGKPRGPSPAVWSGGGKKGAETGEGALVHSPETAKLYEAADPRRRPSSPSSLSSPPASSW